MTPLRQRMLDALVLHGKAARAQDAYISAVAQLARHYRRSPDALSGAEIEAYLLHLLRPAHWAKRIATVARWRSGGVQRVHRPPCIPTWRQGM